MIKRKLISSALILALVMTVAGCGNAKNKSNSEQNNSQIAQETTQAAAETAKAEEKTTGETKPSVDYSPYDELIKKAANILKNGYSSQDKVDISPVFFYKQSGYETLGYIKKDLDNDGIDELIFGGTVNLSLIHI